MTNGLSSSQPESSRGWFRRFDLCLEHFEVTGDAFEVVHQARGASCTENPRCRHLLSYTERAHRLCVLAGNFSVGTNRFCRSNGRTSSVDERPPFIILAGHDGLAHVITTSTTSSRS